LDDFVQTTPYYLCNHEGELHRWRHEFSYQVVGFQINEQIDILFIHNLAFSVCQFLKFHVYIALVINASHHFDIKYSQNLCH
jgi:hypothetical protein